MEVQVIEEEVKIRCQLSLSESEDNTIMIRNQKFVFASFVKMSQNHLKFLTWHGAQQDYDLRFVSQTGENKCAGCYF